MGPRWWALLLVAASFLATLGGAQQEMACLVTAVVDPAQSPIALNGRVTEPIGGDIKGEGAAAIAGAIHVVLPTIEGAISSITCSRGGRMGWPTPLGAVPGNMDCAPPPGSEPLMTSMHAPPAAHMLTPCAPSSHRSLPHSRAAAHGAADCLCQHAGGRGGHHHRSAHHQGISLHWRPAGQRRLCLSGGLHGMWRGCKATASLAVGAHLAVCTQRAWKRGSWCVHADHAKRTHHSHTLPLNGAHCRPQCHRPPARSWPQAAAASTSQ